MIKNVSKRKLKIERNKQVSNFWNEYYLKKGILVENIKVQELCLENDGFYKYVVNANIKEGNLSFEYFAKFDTNNQMI